MWEEGEASDWELKGRGMIPLMQGRGMTQRKDSMSWTWRNEPASRASAGEGIEKCQDLWVLVKGRSGKTPTRNSCQGCSHDKITLTTEELSYIFSLCQFLCMGWLHVEQNWRNYQVEEFIWRSTQAAKTQQGFALREVTVVTPHAFIHLFELHWMVREDGLISLGY